MSSNSTRAALVGLALLFALASCRKEPDMGPIEETIPLQVGNEWVYQVTDYDINGAVLTVSAAKTKVLKDTIINKGTWYVLSNGQIVQNNHEGYVYFNKADNRGLMIYPSAAHGGIGYMYQYPNYNLWVLTNRTYTLEPIVGAIENLAGYTFQIKKEYAQQGSTFTFKQNDYVSPQVGLVRTDNFYIDTEKLMRRTELVNYTLN